MPRNPKDSTDSPKNYKIKDRSKKKKKFIGKNLGVSSRR